jgi:nucleotide-binding universal stress UspA family protein
MSAGGIVVGVDGSAQSVGALRWASWLATTTGLPLRAVTAWRVPPGYGGMYLPESWSPKDDATSSLDRAVDEAFPDGPPTDLQLRVRQGHPVPVLIEESRDATTLVVGSRGRGGFTGLLLGSVSAECARHAGCPVVIVPEAPR